MLCGDVWFDICWACWYQFGGIGCSRAWFGECSIWWQCMCLCRVLWFHAFTPSSSRSFNLSAFSLEALVCWLPVWWLVGLNVSDANECLISSMTNDPIRQGIKVHFHLGNATVSLSKSIRHPALAGMFQIGPIKKYPKTNIVSGSESQEVGHGCLVRRDKWSLSLDH